MDNSNTALWTILNFEFGIVLQIVSWNSKQFIYIFKQLKPWVGALWSESELYEKYDMDSLQGGIGLEELQVTSILRDLSIQR